MLALVLLMSLSVQPPEAAVVGEQDAQAHLAVIALGQFPGICCVLALHRPPDDIDRLPANRRRGDRHVQRQSRPYFPGPPPTLLLKTLPAMDVKLELKAPTLFTQLFVPVALCEGVCAVMSA